MSIRESGFDSSYYYNLDQEQVETQSSDSTCGPASTAVIVSGVISSIVGGIFSTTSITVLTAKVWEEASYVIPVVSVTATAMVCGALYRGFNTQETPSKISYWVLGSVSLVPASPFLLGAIPGIMSIALNGILAFRDRGARDDVP